MKLYTFKHAPNPLKIRLALAELGISYEAIQVDFKKRETRGEDFLKLNPFGRVPVLEKGNLILRESNAILAYLGKEEKKLWPVPLADEALALQWLFFDSCHLIQPAATLWLKHGFGPLTNRVPDDAIVQYSTKQLDRFLEPVERHLAKNNFILGDTFSLVDCCLGVTLSLLKGTVFEDPLKWKYVTQYWHTIQRRRSWADSEGSGIYPETTV